MLRDKLKITASETEKMHIVGTPEQYEFFCKRVIARFGVKPIVLACDHSGFRLKEEARKILDEKSLY